MFMNDLMKTEFFSLMIESSQGITNEQIQDAYVDFVKHVGMVNSENDYEKIYRNLSE